MSKSPKLGSKVISTVGRIQAENGEGADAYEVRVALNAQFPAENHGPLEVIHTLVDLAKSGQLKRSEKKRGITNAKTGVYTVVQDPNAS